MANDSANKTISSTTSGFPDYLDFDKLRSEAITYLGNLSGKIWTDHNVHDPGITILEMLIYALLDLGYRTNLPVADLFARNPEDNSKDNNFFTPAQILANNPLTITDYRKLLVDINGVKNAWLEIDGDTSPDFCRTNPDVIAGNYNVAYVEDAEENVCACNNLNGLYHVYIETEKHFDLIKTEEEQQEYDAIVYKVKCALMQHRNLCEDFIDIKILCPLDIGLCADIELEADANGEEVYIKIIEALQSFFSPSPKFYTLPQLLEKGKLIEDIFAGRPYNLKESYGFVDTEEFEEIKLRREIHFSDVYNVLLDVQGVKNVRRFAWKICDDNAWQSVWKLVLPQNHIPEFDPACSSFSFFKYGMAVKIDQKKYASFFKMKYSSGGKILYTQSFNLDTEIPTGTYHKDLADYYSIQNEFPHVYGIGEGDLASDETNERKAKALQLQGFLLFFDQLLANYLTQLKNIRSLFALSSSENKQDNHTYFINQLSTVPQLQKLLRFKTDANSEGTLGSEGSLLAYPTDRKNFEALISSGKIKNTDLEGRCNRNDFPGYTFCYAAVRDQAVTQLREDILYGNYEAIVESNNDECFFFYLITSAQEFILISKNYYSSEQEARNAAVSVKYTASFSENFRNFMSANCEDDSQFFSFNIELTLGTYSGYLQLIAEDDNLYLSRRQDFLNHLLSRFAEQFTDYALLTANFLSSGELQKSQIKAEEKFLINYDDLSSNRGKAYNYLCNGWKNENISGFEKRFKGLAGIEDWRKHYLCNFVVEETDKQYLPEIEIDNNRKLTLQTPLNKSGALASINSVHNKLNSDAFFEMAFLEYENAWQLFTRDEAGNKYIYSELIKTKEDAEERQNLLKNLFFYTPDKQKNIFVSRYIFSIEFKNNTGETLAEYAAPDKRELTDKAKAETKCKALAAEINSTLNDVKTFTWKNAKTGFGNLLALQANEPPFIFINEKAFEFYSPEDINLTEAIKYTYKFRDVNKKVLFQSRTKYNTETESKEAFEKMLPLLTLPSTYYTEPNDDKTIFNILIKAGEANIAMYFTSFAEESAAQKKIDEIIKEVSAYTYSLSMSEPIPSQWKFNFWLTGIDDKKIEFESKKAYSEEALAIDAAKKLYADISNLNIKILNKELLIESPAEKIKAAWKNNTNDENKINAAKKDADTILKFQKALIKNTSGIAENQVNEKLKSWQVNKGENYIYKLADKDNLLAYHTSKKRFSLRQDAEDARDRLVNEKYDYVDINAGGNDIFRCYEDERTKIRWYHYQVKCTNRFYTKGNVAGKELVLFQSVKGYTSKEEAQKAFNENLFVILKNAHKKENYGDGRIISLKEIVIHVNDACIISESIVCVPKQTADELGNYEIQNEIIPLVKSYPIKYIAEERFRFFLYNTAPAIDYYDWRSVSFYTTAQQAMQQFQFFLVLLKYAGNYFIEEDKTDCRFHIYIREVLAQSAHGFNTCEDAWGAIGIEKFICVSQTENSFHNYFKTKDCSHSFFVACNNAGLIHPCRYETPERRDDVLNRLYSASSFSFFELLQTDANNVTLLNLDKNPIAKIYIDKERENYSYSKCDKLIELFELMYDDNNYQEKENNFYLADGNRKIAEPVSYETTWQEWKQQLIMIACYFPVYKKDNTISIRNDGSCNYAVQIKLPAFDSCGEDAAKNIADSNEVDECKPGCYIAWKTDCCFDSCCEALQFYIRCLLLLRNYENYRRVYECNCGYYGIELHTEYITKRTDVISPEFDAIIQTLNFICDDSESSYNTQENNFRYQNINSCLNEITAINPQQYTNELMACEAVERAKKLINSEGLHLVEHILLRPHCVNADGVYQECDCDALPGSCIDDNICKFPWKPGGEKDPCEDKGNPICFTPGCDPYSFIATIALPAWTQRFRSMENRAVIEKLLQKEAPAHVLLRTLWLNPRDFCCFEYEFKNWNYRLAKKLCGDYDNCNFLELLFKKYFMPLTECEVCIPCACDNDESVSCFEEYQDECCDFTSVVNGLFCWKNNCLDKESNEKDEYDFSSCEPCNCRQEDDQANTEEKTIITKARKKPALALLKDVEHRAQIEATEKHEPAAPPSREKVKRIQARAYAYNENVKKITAANPENKVAGNALRFLSDINPEPKRYDDLINSILKDKPDKTKNIKALTLKQKQILIQNITWQYFDRLCFNNKEAGSIKEHEFLFNHLRKNKIDMNALYDGWSSSEVKQIEPGINIKEIKKVLT